MVMLVKKKQVTTVFDAGSLDLYYKWTSGKNATKCGVCPLYYL